MKEFEKGANGVIIGHGTDTMSFTGSALSFMFQNQAAPIVIVGSQRSSDRPSSDGPLNIINASTIAGYVDLAETVVCMHGGTSDSYNLIHRGTRVRKMHSSRRDAFRTLSDIPLGIIDANQKVTFLKDDVRRRGDIADMWVDTKIDPKVFKAMEPYFCDIYSNPSSSHAFGLRSREAIERAREQVASIIKAKSDHVYFTNSATEANNIVLRGLTLTGHRAGNIPTTVVTTNSEHQSILKCAEHLKIDFDNFNVRYIPIEKDGNLDIVMKKH